MSLFPKLKYSSKFNSENIVIFGPLPVWAFGPAGSVKNLEKKYKAIVAIVINVRVCVYCSAYIVGTSYILFIFYIVDIVAIVTNT